MSVVSSPETANVPAFAEATPPAAGVPLLKRGWFRLTALAVLTTILFVLALVGLLSSASRSRTNDPGSHNKVGAAAVAALIGRQGVDVSTSSDVSESTAQIRDRTTLVVSNPDAVTASQWRAVLARSPDDVVVLSGGSSTLTALGAPVTVGPSPQVPRELAPGCSDPDANRAGSVVVSLTSPDLTADLAPRYVAGSSDLVTCYADPSANGAAGYLAYVQGGTTVHLFAGGLQNGSLEQAGNASFSMALLGQHPRLVWLTARSVAAQAPDAPRANPVLVLPRGWGWAGVMSAFTLVVVAGWRGRRFGPILEENLPVRVRACETVEGHGRLYFRNDARGRAADILRSAARNRLQAQFGQSDPGALVSLISDRVGASDQRVSNLLFGPPPGTDAELIGLQQALQLLEKEVRRL